MAQAPRPMKHPVGPRLQRVLTVVFALFALLGVNSVYLSVITAVEWATGGAWQTQFYQWMFGGHLVLGVLFTLPFLLFSALHLRNTHDRPNRRAVGVGWALLAASLLVLTTGVVLTNIEVYGRDLGLRNPASRSVAYWLHVLAPIAAMWLYVLHRLAGRRIKWAVGARWGAVAVVFALSMLGLHSMDARPWGAVGPARADYFEPSLARTATGDFINSDSLMMNDYCLECHADAYQSWAHSVHAASSFNNPVYALSVRETREQAFAATGSVQAARFCAGCHDPVPFFSGAFEASRFDDPNYQVEHDPMGAASITCTSCHSIVAVNSVRGNADYTIEEAQHYPFAFSEQPLLKWMNRQLIRAKPQFHKQTFLKPTVHRTTEFCGACHKVAIPEAVNDYRWLRGQNHYDSFRLSGVSGHGVESWYYPARAETDCNGCHMAARPSDDFGSKMREGVLTTLDHSFASANTAVPLLAKLDGADRVFAECEALNNEVMSVDIFGVIRGADVDAPLEAPIDPSLPTLVPGQPVLLEIVTRALKMGHEFTQGTADSNEVWLDVTVSAPGQSIGRSGGFDGAGAVDPWSKFLNAFVLDRLGRRIDRRNAQDIFVPLYNHQIPPGAADVTHYALELPAGTVGPVKIDVALRYRKFDARLMQLVQPDRAVNDLPVLTLARDSVTLPVAAGAVPVQDGAPPAWQRWYDYGIALLRQGMGGSQKGDLRGAERAFLRVESMGRGEGAIGSARVYLLEGRLDDAVAALGRAGAATTPAVPWSIAYWSAQVDRQHGQYEAAVRNFKAVRASAYPVAIERGFDFAKDDRLLVALAQTQHEWSRSLRASDPERAAALLAAAHADADAALVLDPENASAWHVLAQICADQGLDDEAHSAREAHATYKVDDNARDAAISAARVRYPAANHAAEPIAIYELQRPDRFTGDVTPSTKDRQR